MRAHRHSVLVRGDVCELHDALDAGAVHALGSQVHQHLQRRGSVVKQMDTYANLARRARTRWFSVPPVTSV